MTTKAIRPVFVVGTCANPIHILDHAACILASAESLCGRVAEEDPTDAMHGIGYLIELAAGAVSAARRELAKDDGADK